MEGLYNDGTMNGYKWDLKMPYIQLHITCNGTYISRIFNSLVISQSKSLQ